MPTISIAIGLGDYLVVIISNYPVSGFRWSFKWLTVNNGPVIDVTTWEPAYSKAVWAGSCFQTAARG
jgi:hypothetical protein